MTADAVVFTADQLRDAKQLGERAIAAAAQHAPVEKAQQAQVAWELVQAVVAHELPVRGAVLFLQQWAQRVDPQFRHGEGKEQLAPEVREMLLDVVLTVDDGLQTDEEAWVQTLPAPERERRNQLPPEARPLHPARERLVALVGEFARAPLIDALTMLGDRVDLAVLGKARLIDQMRMFQKTVRMNTALLYKQQKFNLLREESEGYSKLVVELCGQGRLLGAAVDGETAAARRLRIRARAQVALRNVQTLIGHFDLDPNRVLAILLDLFATHLHAQWEFYLELILCSPWRSASGAITQLLGFSFISYHGSDGTSEKRQEARATPRTLAQLAALLVKHRLVQLDNLMPHLAPKDPEHVAKVELPLFEKWRAADALKDQELSALAVAAPLTQDGGVAVTDGPTAKEAERAEREKRLADVRAAREALDAARAANQRALLADSLLLVGDLAHAGQILSNLAQTLVVYPELNALLCRTLHVSLENVYRRVWTYPGRLGDGAVATTAAEPTATDDWRSTPPFVGPSANGAETKVPAFFYDAWMRGIPRAPNLETLHEFLAPYLAVLGPMLHVDELLLGKLLRLARAATAQAPAVANAWLRFLAWSFLPALSLTNGNAFLCLAVWDVLSEQPYDVRYSVYSEFKSRALRAFPMARAAHADARGHAGRYFKQLSNVTARHMGRQLGKLSHANPVAALASLVASVQQNDKLIGPAVDACKYLTAFEMDLLGYTVLCELQARPAGRVQADGVHLCAWFSLTIGLAGALNRRYTVQLAPLLDHVLDRVAAGELTDALLLRELVQTMGGIELPPTGAGTTEALLEGQTGFDELRKEVCYQLSGKGTRRSSRWFARALLADSAHRAGMLAVALGQLCVTLGGSGDADDEVPLKVVAARMDQAVDVFFHYAELLHLYLTPAQLVSALPTVKVLQDEFGVPAPLALHLLRPVPGELASPSPDVTASFFTMFWKLSMRDLTCPEERYRRLVEQMNNVAGAEKGSRKERGRAAELATALAEECERQRLHVAATRKRLEVECGTWFATERPRGAVAAAALQHCILPRALLSPIDAQFAARMLWTVHALGTSHFATLSVLDAVFVDVRAIVAACTEREAFSFGRFLSELFEPLTAWYVSAEAYDADAIAAPRIGFRHRWPSSLAGPSAAEARNLQHREFRLLMFKWQRCLQRAFARCLQTGEYVCMRNAIVVLTVVERHFPLVREVGHALAELVEQRRSEESRQDLKLLLGGYHSRLQSARPRWKSSSEFTSALEPSMASPGASRGSLAAGKVSEESAGVSAMETDCMAAASSNDGTSAMEAASSKAKEDSEEPECAEMETDSVPAEESV